MTDDTKAEFIAYPLTTGEELGGIRPAPRLRQWQHDTQDAFASRCLPLNIANNNGWEITLPGGFDAVYTGGAPTSEVSIYPHGDGPVIAASHFGHGVLTMFVDYLFRTPRGVSLQISGPVNLVRDGIQALVGIIESDWSPYSLTMNWKFTRPGRVRFLKGEAYAQIVPTPADFVNAFAPRFGVLGEDEPEAEEDYSRWSRSRSHFNHALVNKDPETVKQKWQKLYYRGLYPDGKRKATDHLMKLDPPAFARREALSVKPGPNWDEKRRRVDRPAPKDATALIRATQIDWRTHRTLDEIATRVKQAIVFLPEGTSGLDAARRNTPYANVEFLELDRNEDARPFLRDRARFNHVLTIETKHLLPTQFWEHFEGYCQLLDEKYDEVHLPLFRARNWYSTLAQFEEHARRGAATVDPLNDAQCVLGNRTSIGASNNKEFLASDQVTIA